MPEPKFVRFVVWVGSRKRWYLAAYALAAAFIGIVAFALSGDAFPNKTPGFLVFLGLVSAAGGIAFGWFMWELFIWPTLAAYPGSTEWPPNQRPKGWDES